MFFFFFFFLIFQRRDFISFSNTAAQDDVCDKLHSALAQRGVTDVEVEPPPAGMEEEYKVLLTPEALEFVAELVRHFNDKVDLVSTINSLCT